MQQAWMEYFVLSEEANQARRLGQPLVALESTVITHGLPYPENLALARDMEDEVRRQGAVPATIAVMDGCIQAGLSSEQLERLAQEKDVHKISSRDFAPAIAGRWNGGTTVAATMLAAHSLGIEVFATGGIGGVHRRLGRQVSEVSNDISADLPQLASTPMIVVCAGAKAILDLPATLEYLETWAIPVVGYGVDEFPAFYMRSSGLKTSCRADSAPEVAAMARAHWKLGLRSAILVTNPIPATFSAKPEVVNTAIEQALVEAEKQGIHGQAVTPFLLKRVSELTGGESLKANLELLKNNARLAGQIALSL